MMTVKNLLEKNQHVNGWRITEKATLSYELFFVHQSLETVRATDTVSTSVTVYVDHDGAKGDSTFAVYQSMTEADIAAKIEAAVARAKLVSNQPYDLPEAGELSAELPTNMKDCDMKELGVKIADAVFAADTLPGGSINACEIFLYRDTVRVLNSRGVDKTQVTHRAMIEAIPTFTTEKESVELYEDYRFTQFDAAKITAEIAEKMQEVKARSEAVKPAVPMTVNVILRPHEISELISELAWDLNYASVYSHANLHHQGDDLQKDGKGDKLTLTLKAVVEGSEKSACFDDDGLALTDTCVIENGVVKNYFGASRFGQYLNVEKPSGSLRCAQVAPGTLPMADMKRQPCLDIVSMSGLQLDLYNDYIGGEIRLAYYFDGEKTVPVTGITMSAKLSEALSSMNLSTETGVSGEYDGPQRMLLKGIAVL